MHFFPDTKRSLIERLRGCPGGNGRDWPEFFETYDPAIFGLCRYLCRELGFGRDEVEDIAQEVRIRVFSRVRSFQGRGRFRDWMNRVIRNMVYSHLRKSRARDKHLARFRFQQGCAPTQHESDATLEIDEQLDRPFDVSRACKILRNLGPELRSRKMLPCFYLRAIAAHTIRETAEALGVCDETVRRNDKEMTSFLLGLDLDKEHAPSTKGVS